MWVKEKSTIGNFEREIDIILYLPSPPKRASKLISV